MVETLHITSLQGFQITRI